MTIYLVCGLPASGKSLWAQQQFGHVIDDPLGYAQLQIQVDEDNYIVSPYFSDYNIRTKVARKLEINWPRHEVKYIFFENDLEQCLVNAKRRPEKLVYGFIHYLNKIYNPPKDSIPVWKPIGVEGEV